MSGRPEPALLPGIHRRLTPAGRRFTLSIPDNMSGEKAVPLILALHYGGPFTPYYGEGLLVGLVEPALRDLGAIMAAPDCTTGTWDNAQSAAEIEMFLDYLLVTYPIDPGRITLAGYSLGGIGTWYLAARYPARFLAAIPISAGPPAEIDPAGWRVPLTVIHSRRDELFPFDRVEGTVRRLRAAGAPVELIALKEPGHYETGRFVPALRSTVPWLEALLASERE